MWCVCYSTCARDPGLAAWQLACTPHRGADGAAPAAQSLSHQPETRMLPVSTIPPTCPAPLAVILLLPFTTRSAAAVVEVAAPPLRHHCFSPASAWPHRKSLRAQSHSIQAAGREWACAHAKQNACSSCDQTGGRLSNRLTALACQRTHHPATAAPAAVGMLMHAAPLHCAAAQPAALAPPYAAAARNRAVVPDARTACAAQTMAL